jgi:hypothetical protein
MDIVIVLGPGPLSRLSILLIYRFCLSFKTGRYEVRERALISFWWAIGSPPDPNIIMHHAS